MRIHLSIIFAFCMAAGFAAGQDSNTTQPDNTGVNKRDRSPDQVTADQQKEDKADLKLTKQIRRSIVSDKSLSTDAHNVKVISQHGTVTLKGPVKSDEEKSAVIAKAVAVVGSADKVTDQLSVKH